MSYSLSATSAAATSTVSLVDDAADLVAVVFAPADVELFLLPLERSANKRFNSNY